MRSRKLEPPEPLPPGQYLVRCREISASAAALNSHAEVYPMAVGVSDGKWCVFYRDGEEVWSCNATYAAAHFDIVPLGDDARHDQTPSSGDTPTRRVEQTGLFEPEADEKQPDGTLGISR